MATQVFITQVIMKVTVVLLTIYSRRGTMTTTIKDIPNQWQYDQWQDKHTLQHVFVDCMIDSKSKGQPAVEIDITQLPVGTEIKRGK